MHRAEKHGATHTMMIRVLGSLLTTWHKVQYVEGSPLLPVYQEYAVPRNPYSMSAHILTNPESLPGKWTQWTGDTVLWPSPPLLYQVAQQFSLNASLPHMFLPSPDLSSVLYWYVTSFTGHWPETPASIPSVAFVDTPKPIRRQGCITGVIYWSVKYGYSEHHRYLTCINQDRHRTFIPQAAVMQHVFKAVFASLAMPSGPRISRLSHSNATTQSIRLASKLICMKLISARLAMSPSEAKLQCTQCKDFQPRGNA